MSYSKNLPTQVEYLFWEILNYEWLPLSNLLVFPACLFMECDLFLTSEHMAENSEHLKQFPHASQNFMISLIKYARRHLKTQILTSAKSHREEREATTETHDK